MAKSNTGRLSREQSVPQRALRYILRPSLRPRDVVTTQAVVLTRPGEETYPFVFMDLPTTPSPTIDPAEVCPNPYEVAAEDCPRGPNHHLLRCVHPTHHSMDSATDKSNKRSKATAAIFIHAGAGYHSTYNELIHLRACSKAATVGMRILKSGGSAVEAVEAAIKVLEDEEITNAGYGSNLCIDGTVECDATIVNHLGRSGACGAVPNIKNPVSLARLILESSNKPLTLRRVPPNLLVGEGAREFAKHAGMKTVSNDALISNNARDRFTRWVQDLKQAEQAKYREWSYAARLQVDESLRKGDHTSAILTGTWNEGQPDSPTTVVLPASPWETAQKRKLPVSTSAPTTPGAPAQPLGTNNSPERTTMGFLGSMVAVAKSSSPIKLTPPSKRQRTAPSVGAAQDPTTSGPNNANGMPAHPSSRLGPHDSGSDEHESGFGHEQGHGQEHGLEDNITDTVGAIAIDQSGLIAAASSSGGIGMKHRGRVGPAALVGVGTAVVPVSEGDPEGITVAAVTSGTGEHMATSMASQRCAERLYQGTIRGADGRDVSEDDESVILESFITDDFAKHPGVRDSTSTGAIGVMAVKKAPQGYYLYFAHNTDSFALASMGSNDREPSCVMSRIKEGSTRIAQGALKIAI